MDGYCTGHHLNDVWLLLPQLGERVCWVGVGEDVWKDDLSTWVVDDGGCSDMGGYGLPVRSNVKLLKA